MSGDGAKRPSIRGFKPGRRKAVRLSQQDLVTTRFLEDLEGGMPLVFEPKVEAFDLVSWVASSRDFLISRLHKHGALLFRGFPVEGTEGFRSFARAVSSELLDYRERAAPRHQVGSNVYTSTEFPADQHIPLHHEMSYSYNWPLKIWFYCAQPPQAGGRTPIADDRKIVDLIDPAIKERFAKKGVCYVRNYGEGVDLSWQEAFQTEEREVVEAYCARAGMQVEWRDHDRLRTWSPRQVLVTHPVTGDTVWFNHAHMFHSSNMPVEIREALLSEFAEDELPRNAFYGDRTPIETSVVEEIRRLYREQSIAFEWRQGDILMVDNILVSHGREPFEGPRKILVAMAEPGTDPGPQ